MANFCQRVRKPGYFSRFLTVRRQGHCWRMFPLFVVSHLVTSVKHLSSLFEDVLNIHEEVTVLLSAFQNRERRNSIL